MATPLPYRSIRISMLALAPAGGRLRVARVVVQNASVVLLVGLVWLMLAHALPAQAATPYEVTNCTAQGLVDAMNQFNNNLTTDGIISFNCDNVHAAATITIGYPGGFSVATGAAYAIDGGNLVTVSGGGTNRLFDVMAGAALTLTNIILTDGFADTGGDQPTQGGAIVNEGILLVLDHVTIRNSNSSIAGGAIADFGGTTVVMDSLLENNVSDYGGAIDSSGTLTLISTTVRSNHALTDTGGGLDVGGTVVISNSQIVSNTATGNGNGGGGGLNITGSGRVSISGSRLDANQIPTTTYTFGGAIRNLGVLTVTQSTLSGNSASDSGGGIYNIGTATLNNSALSANSASAGGGIDNIGTATLNNSTLGSNSASAGGGILNYGTVTLNYATLSGNSAFVGGGIWNISLVTLINSTLSGNSGLDGGGGIWNYGGTATLNNSTLSGNTATNGVGGGIYNKAQASLFNVTLSNNSATTGGALFSASGTTVLTNTILAYSPAGGNCNGTITASKYTFSSDFSCALAGTGDQNHIDPLLTALGNYGGPTLVHMLKLGSPAIDGVVGSDAPAIDQRGAPRPGPDGSYDIGAVERQPADSDLAPRLYLPLLVR